MAEPIDMTFGYRLMRVQGRLSQMGVQIDPMKRGTFKGDDDGIDPHVVDQRINCWPVADVRNFPLTGCVAAIRQITLHTCY